MPHIPSPLDVAHRLTDRPVDRHGETAWMWRRRVDLARRETARELGHEPSGHESSGHEPPLGIRRLVQLIAGAATYCGLLRVLQLIAAYCGCCNLLRLIAGALHGHPLGIRESAFAGDEAPALPAVGSCRRRAVSHRVMSHRVMSRRAVSHESGHEPLLAMAPQTLPLGTSCALGSSCLLKARQ
jgi:hypothetical protein